MTLNTHIMMNPAVNARPFRPILSSSITLAGVISLKTATMTAPHMAPHRPAVPFIVNDTAMHMADAARKTPADHFITGISAWDKGYLKLLPSGMLISVSGPAAVLPSGICPWGAVMPSALLLASLSV